MEIALINLKDVKGVIWTVPVQRIYKMRMKSNDEVQVYLENDEMPYILVEDYNMILRTLWDLMDTIKY